jgi:hypothetical protein
MIGGFARRLRACTWARALGVGLVLAGCSAPQGASNEEPSRCALDADCGKGRYCSEAFVCRSDCTIDAHCYGPSTTAQCNAQGRCIEVIDPAASPADAAAPLEGGAPDAPLSEGGG